VNCGRILLLALGGDSGGLEQHLVQGGWEVARASDLESARRLLAQRRCPVGLLTIGHVLPMPVADIEACVNGPGGAEWAVLCDAQALESPVARDLVLDSFFDYLIRPAQWQELDIVLEHACRRSLLRHRHNRRMQESGALGLVGQGPVIQHLRQQIRKVAVTEVPVLISGESGSGKELTARAIHDCSQRSSGPFVAVNCGAIAPSLIQSELFGHERGAFTGASTERRGLIEAANGGTIFLDEIGDLPLELQTNLLRFLQEKTINRVGAVRSLKVDARVVAATHVNLAEAVALGRIREDLFYRLNVLPIEVPPLRERLEDVPMLAQYFFERCVAGRIARVEGFSRQATAAMAAHSWPGNVREMHNRVQRAVVMAEQRLIRPEDLGLAHAETAAGIGLDAARTMAERDAISITLTRVGRNITKASRELGVSRMTLYRLMDKHGIAPAVQSVRVSPSGMAG
jgi:two-component system, NtrC family, response regulator HydG